MENKKRLKMENKKIIYMFIGLLLLILSIVVDIVPIYFLGGFIFISNLGGISEVVKQFNNHE